MNGEQLCIKMLRDHGASNTSVRRAIFGILAGHDLLTMRQLTDLAGDVADTASVYRTIELFEQLGIIHKVYTGWKYRVELSDAFRPHHHHAICRECGRVIPLEENPKLERLIQTWAAAHHMHQTAHSLEITGVCSDCLTQSDSAQSL